MGKFILGLIVGAVLGVFVMTVNPNLPEELRVGLANVTALVMRGAENAAEGVGEAADEIANEAEEATGGTPEPAGEPAERVQQ